MTRRDVLKFQWFTFLPQIHIICEIQNLSIGPFLGFPRVSQQPAKKLYTPQEKNGFMSTLEAQPRDFNPFGFFKKINFWYCAFFLCGEAIGAAVAWLLYRCSSCFHILGRAEAPWKMRFKPFTSFVFNTSC